MLSFIYLPHLVQRYPKHSIYCLVTFNFVTFCFPRDSAGKEYAWNVGSLGSIPGLGRFPWRRESPPTPVFWLENRMDCIVLLLLSRFRLCDHIDGSPSGSPVPGILQARTLERVAISFSNAWKWKVKVKSLSHVRLIATPWTAAHQAPPSTGFSRQEYWSGVPWPSPTV